MHTVNVSRLYRNAREAIKHLWAASALGLNTGALKMLDVKYWRTTNVQDVKLQDMKMQDMK